MKLVLNAPAKINLFLEITGKRHDGYHDIESVMQSVTLFDTLHFEKRDNRGERSVIITSDCPGMPVDGTNLICRAATALFDVTKTESYSLAVHVEKRIPMAAGLGGGSADAAAALIAVNQLYGMGFTENELCSVGGRIGADVPFCVKRGIAVTRGIGDIMSDCPKLPDCYVAVACGGEGVSTPFAYKRLDEMFDFSRRTAKVDDFTEVLAGGDIKAIADKMTNIFEEAVLPEREVARTIRDTFANCGALRAMMSGSGPSVIGVFDEPEFAARAKRELANKDITVHITKPYYPV